MSNELNVAEIKAEAMQMAGAHVRGQHSNNKVIRLCSEIESLRARVEKVEAERDTYKEHFGEYAACLQHLCMNVLYEPCRPASHSWPGKPHTETIVEGVNVLLERAARNPVE